MDSSIVFAPAFFGGGSGIHWIILLVIALLLFGRRLPEIMRGLGGSIREFKKGIDEGGNANTNTNSDHQPDGAMSRQTPAPKVTAPEAEQTADERAKTVQPANEPPKHY
jgi:sec-independent protein translocase protein TatA